MICVSFYQKKSKTDLKKFDLKGRMNVRISDVNIFYSPPDKNYPTLSM